jgi:hypothetical protein
MHQNYLRLGNREFFDVGEDMIRHRQDIDQYHVENSEPYLGGFQRYEKGEHGNLARQKERYGQKAASWELNSNPSHTWNRDLLLHWALMGDPRSLEAAEQNGRAYERYFRSNRNWAGTNCVEYGEFRVPGWGIENFLALYEYTGKTQWLGRAEEVFDKTLSAMERKNGTQGHIIKSGEQSAQFLMMIVEPVCRLHHYTGRKDIEGFLRRVLDWQLQKRSCGGYEKGKMYCVTEWQTDDWEKKPEETRLGSSNAYSIGMLDGYAYLYRLTGERRYLELARRLFKESIFYFAYGGSFDKSVRTPLGFHYLGTPVALHAEKMQALMGRYGQLYMQIEVDRHR